MYTKLLCFFIIPLFYFICLFKKNNIYIQHMNKFILSLLLNFAQPVDLDSEHMALGGGFLDQMKQQVRDGLALPKVLVDKEGNETPVNDGSLSSEDSDSEDDSDTDSDDYGLNLAQADTEVEKHGKHKKKGKGKHEKTKKKNKKKKDKMRKEAKKK